MTIITNMALTDDKQHLGDKQKQRSERASSLALPHSSLLDFNNMQQEQCNYDALLPDSSNIVARRHSSHCSLTLENENQHSQQQQPHHHQQQQKNHRVSPAHELLSHQSVVGIKNRSKTDGKSIIPFNEELKKESQPQDFQTFQTFLLEHQQHRPVQQQTNNSNSTSTFSKDLNKKTSGLQKREHEQQQYRATSNPPPPIPKRTFRNKFTWKTAILKKEEGCVEPVAETFQNANKDKQPLIEGTFCLHLDELQQSPTASSDFSKKNINEVITNKENFKPGSAYFEAGAYNCGSGYDTSGASDDDHMSLENSVFEESFNSTPVRLPANPSNKQLSVTLAARTLAAFNAGDANNFVKRTNRSSSSTVDCSITSSGYGSSSHSERFASTSTTADVRSRFSSVDTQSSVDSCLAERTSAESPLIKEIPYKSECFTDEALHTINNNEMKSDLVSHGYNFIGNDNNNSAPFNRKSANEENSIPSIPKRSGQRKTAQLKEHESSMQFNLKSQSQQSLNNSIGSSNKACSTVPNSTSTSSTASAGSSISTGSSTSISGSGLGNSPQSAQGKQTQAEHKKRSPIPPARVHNSQFEDSIPNKKNNLQHTFLTIRKQLNPKLHQRQVSNVSTDSFSTTSSPVYNSKTLTDDPLLQNGSHMNKCNTNVKHDLASSKLNSTAPAVPPRSKFTFRQDSAVSSDSFSQTSSPGYNTKIMEAPLLPSLSVKRLCNVSTSINFKKKFQNDSIDELENNVPLSQITKCVSTPASLQTIVRFQDGAPNTMSLSHQVVSARKSSKPFIRNRRLTFRLLQILVNVVALLAIAGGLAAYFNAYPIIKFVNKTIISTVHVQDPLNYGENPAPGTCLPIIVKFCQGPQIPYNFTVFPNYIGHFGQLGTEEDLEPYEALVDVRCYKLVSLYLCTLFVPKCGKTGAIVPPCKSLCTETMRRCGFFFEVFGLPLPEYLNCKLFKDFESPDDCVGFEQVKNVMIASAHPKCKGFLCDNNRCIPRGYVCDGNLDCMDHADETACAMCAKDEIFCGNGKCITIDDICNGIIDCPYGQDEKNCIRLSERNGDLGKGVLEVFRINTTTWTPACVKHWDRAVSPSAVCSMLGYSAVNATSVITQKTHRPLLTSVNVSTDIWELYSKKKFNLIEEFSNCKPDEDYPIAELTCSNFDCGKVKNMKRNLSRRIIGGAKAHPGSWPFLAAILGGPEKIFYCAGALISDQWVLTASHCIGNHTRIDLEDWTIQLGVTRRNSYTYSSQEVKVKTVITHPLYNMAIIHDNDIALFQLAKRVAFHEHLLPVCLPPPNMKQLKPDAMCTAIGWGKKRDKDPRVTYEPVVHEVQVPIIGRQQCDEWLDNLTVSEGMICAGYEEGGKDACQGDSGGPLLCPYPGEKDKWFVGGIVSWGIMCAHPKLPGIYANVIKYLPWINEQMQKYSKEESYSKYDVHPGGPDILSNLATVSLKNNKKSYKSHNSNQTNSDYMTADRKNITVIHTT